MSQPVHSVLSPHRQRMALIIASIVAQFALYVVVLVQFTQYFVYFYWICVGVSLAVSLFISTLTFKMAYKIAWIIPILLVPLIGGVMYIILGGSRKPHYRRAETRRAMKHYLVPQLSTTDFLHYGADAMQQAWYLEHAALCPAYRNTETTYYPTGADFFPVFLRELAQAKEYIFLEYFIIAEGSMWSDVLDILTEKAAAGVEVRVIYDGVGSAPTLPSDYPQQLAQKGIRCQEFQPLRPLLSIHQNNRDHRKICVIDGVTGFVSGLNLADEYVDRKERFGYWKDNALRLRGEAVWSLAVFFLTMWNHQNPHTDFSPFRPKALPPVNTTGGIVVPYADTPDPADTVGADLHLQMITKAKRYLYLTTPYLVIDETITAALCTAARSGVDVRILTPHIPDKKVVFEVTQSNYPVLLEAGVRLSVASNGVDVHSGRPLDLPEVSGAGSVLSLRKSFACLQAGNGLAPIQSFFPEGDSSLLCVLVSRSLREDLAWEFAQRASQREWVHITPCLEVPEEQPRLGAVHRFYWEV